MNPLGEVRILEGQPFLEGFVRAFRASVILLMAILAACSGTIEPTAALAHANSACAASGLNDFDQSDPIGQQASQVQTAADSWRYYGLPHGAPGKLGLCRGGTGER